MHFEAGRRRGEEKKDGIAVQEREATLKKEKFNISMIPGKNYESSPYFSVSAKVPRMRSKFK